MHDKLICTVYELHLLKDMHLLEATVVIYEILACHAHPGVLQCLQIAKEMVSPLKNIQI